MVKLIDDSLAELRPQKEAAPKPKAAAPQPEEKWSRENHPAFKKPPAPAPAPAEDKEPEAAVVYQVNDTVTAKWLSGDKGFYPARITSVTGSSTNPIYTVKFKSYDTVETLRAKDIRPTAQKRKADGSTAASNSAGPVTYSPTSGVTVDPAAAAQSSSSSAVMSSSGAVLTAPANLYPQAQQASQEGAEGEDKPRKKFKKIKAKKELEAGKNKWQEFNAKGKFGKSQKKDSMFRTPDGVHGRGTFFPSLLPWARLMNRLFANFFSLSVVGFTGSGQAMRKDPTRSRHVYQANEELD
jgi:survival-of-motor-neuron-related-splicing factor 30